MLEHLTHRRRQQPSHDLLDRISTNGQAGLLSIDIGRHLRPASYLKLLSHARSQHALATGLQPQLDTHHCRLVITNSEITYIHKVMPKQRFHIHTRLLGWDKRYLYYDQRLEVDNTLHTHALLRTVIMQAEQPLPIATFQQLVGSQRLSPALPEYIDSWKALLKDKKRYTLSP